jgi:hypothetical protein
VFQLRKNRTLLSSLPEQETLSPKENIQSSRSNDERRGTRRRFGKRGSPGVRSTTPLLGRKNIEPKPPDRPFIISSVGRYQRDEKIILEVTIQAKNNKIHNTTAMVDCGATENFIDKDYTEQIKIRLDKKKIPRRVLAVDGREITSGPVTHDTSVELIINNHREKIKLHCITIGNSPIIMGLPWLKQHNPNIDWKEGRVTFNSEKCAKMCLEQSPHARTIPEESAIRQYHRDLI